MTRIAILISGRGSNMFALANSIREGKIGNAEIVLVISDKAEAAGIPLAREHGLNAMVIERLGRKREDHEREVIAILKEHRVDLICLAGTCACYRPSSFRPFRCAF